MGRGPGPDQLPRLDASGGLGERTEYRLEHVVVGIEIGAHDRYVELPPIAAAVVGGRPVVAVFELSTREALAVEAADLRRLDADNACLLARDEHDAPLRIENLARDRGGLERLRNAAQLGVLGKRRTGGHGPLPYGPRAEATGVLSAHLSLIHISEPTRRTPIS